MRTSMKSIAAALSAAMFCLMSCVNLSTGDGNQNNGGNPKDDTPSSKDDEPKKDDSGDVYVLDAADGDFIQNDGSRFSYRYFEKPVYITPEWSKVPVLQSYAGSYPLDNLDFELELVYSYPSNVLMYEDGEYLLKIGLIYDGYSCRVGALMDVDGNDCISCQYDSKERLSKLTWYYRDGAYEEEYVNVFSYDDQSRLSEIKLTSENEDCTTLISFEYSSIPSKTVYPLQLVNAESVFCEVLGDSYACVPLVMSGLMGKPFSDCLLKSMKVAESDDASEAGEEYSYVLDANGYVKEMKSRRWENGNSGSLTTLSSSFEWKKL